MIDWSKFDMSRAEMRYAISNSPIFLLDGLREDHEVRRLANETVPEVLLSAFEDSLKDRTTNLAATVRPFALIAAAAVKRDGKLLSDIAERASEYGGWIALLAAAARESPMASAFKSFPYRPHPQLSAGANRVGAENVRTTNNILTPS